MDSKDKPYPDRLFGRKIKIDSLICVGVGIICITLGALFLLYNNSEYFHSWTGYGLCVMGAVFLLVGGCMFYSDIFAKKDTE